MAKQRVVNTRFWDDDYVMDLAPDAKLLFLYCITNPLTDLCGAYEITLRRMAFDTGLKVAKVVAILDQFADDRKMLFRDGWLIIVNFAKHQQGNNPKVANGVMRSLKGCPDWVKDALSTGIDTLLTGHRTLTSRENLDSARQTQPTDAREEKKPSVTAQPEIDAMDAYELGYPLADLLKFFPSVALTPAQVGMILAKVKDTPADRAAWAATIEQYVGNHDPATKSYLPQKVGNLLSVFESKRKELEKNGTDRKSYRQERADEARAEYEFESELRERVGRRKAELQRSPVSDHRGQLPPFESVSDG